MQKSLLIGIVATACVVFVVSSSLGFFFLLKRKRAADPGDVPPNIKPPDIKPPDVKPPDVKPPDDGPPDVKPPDDGPPDVKPPDDEPPASDCASFARASVYLESDARFFYCKCSTEGTIGRQNDGGFYDGDILIEPGLDSADDLASYLHTFAFGHEYWNRGSIGCLHGGSWEAFTNCFMSSKLSSYTLDSKSVLVIEDGIVVCDLATVRCVGIVIRHNGILLIKGDRNVRISCEFILVESGGLLQAGSNHASGLYRFLPKLDIVLTHPAQGYDAMGSITSQYSYKVYNPGAVIQSTDIAQSSYAGKSNFENMFDAKVIAVGFNGNVTMCGTVGVPTHYTRTWNVFEENKTDLFLDTTDSLTTFETKQDAALQDIQFEYPATWLRLVDDVFEQGSSSIRVDPLQWDSMKHWKSGDEVVISGKSEQFTVFGDPQGMLPFWVNNQDAASRKANKDANTKFQAKFAKRFQNVGPMPDKSSGCEVQTISSIDYTKGIIYFQSPLEFRHDSTYTLVDRSNATGVSGVGISAKIWVGTCLHVGLLSRNITIRSQLNADGSGCNVMNRQQPAPSLFKGPGGSVVCNNDSINRNGAEIYAQCYANRAVNNLKYCNNQQPSGATGSWIFNNESQPGCNAIFGGHCFFRYGSSVTLDGVELKYMSTPANFGSIGRYGLHWHLAGYPRDFKGYLPADAGNYTRDATFANGSNWLSFSRWVVLHGTHNVSIRNNVFFVSYGSGLFVEDGTEIANTFEHNLCLLTLLCDTDPYYNPGSIYANAASDIAAASIIWLKNNQNRVIRNVMACGPSPVVAIWMVPQIIGALRGPSTVCLGDPIRKLPGLASILNARGDNSSRSYLSQNKNTWQSVASQLGLQTPCWAPDEFFTQKTISGAQTHCPSYSARNDLNPYSLNVDNVIYNLLSGMTEFPEALGDPPPDFYGKDGFNATGGESYNQTLVGYTPGPQYIPFNAQTSCTDSQAVSQGIYSQASWGGGESDFPYQPLSPSFLQDYDAKGYTISLESRSKTLLKIISGWLSYNMGATTDLVGGAAWIKEGSVACFGCAFLETSLRVSKGTDLNPATKADRMSPPWCAYASNRGNTSNGSFDPCYSSLFQCSVIQGPNDRFSSIYSMFDNCIFNGGFAIPCNPTVYSGSKLFFGDRVVLVTSEYNAGQGASNHMYFADTLCAPDQLLSSNIWKNRDADITQIAIIDFDRRFYQKVQGQGRTNANVGSLPQNMTAVPSANIRKYPYICGDDGNLFRMEETSPFRTAPTLGIVANIPLQCFVTSKAIAKGDRMCQLFQRIQPNLTL
jgi:hypothetical protein